MRRNIFVVALVGVVAAFATVALGAGGGNPHFVGDVTFTDQGTTLNAQGTIAGLGNLDTVVIVSAQGVPTVTCTNQGGTQAPGQNPGISTFTGAQQIDSSDINGNINFNVTSAEPQAPTPKQAGCPNNKTWTASVTDVDFSSATITFFQGEGCAINSGTGQPNNNCTQVFSQTFQV
jgi:hypothetical protein